MQSIYPYLSHWLVQHFFIFSHWLSEIPSFYDRMILQFYLCIHRGEHLVLLLFYADFWRFVFRSFSRKKMTSYSLSRFLFCAICLFISWLVNEIFFSSFSDCRFSVFRFKYLLCSKCYRIFWMFWFYFYSLVVNLNSANQINTVFDSKKSYFSLFDIHSLTTLNLGLLNAMLGC